MNLTDPIFTDADKAREHLEQTRWPHGPICPHCGVTNEATQMKGKAHRAGLYQCNACREQFTVTVGTVFERSKVPLNKWLLATYLMSSSKKGISAHQIGRSLRVTYKTAWFMCHRIREAMNEDPIAPMGGNGTPVEVDETFFGKTGNMPKNRQNWQHKNRVLSLVDRATGRAKSYVVADFKIETIGPIVRQNVAREAHLMTDEARHYTALGKEYAAHGTVCHGQDEYVSAANPTVHTNTIEGFFGIFKRGMKGIYQHCGSQHLRRYMAEFDFRYSHRSGLGIEDAERANEVLRHVGGKRLTYRSSNEAAHA